ncbi:MAG: DNA recombination protein RmuC, partial [Flavobacteriaceae bacterium]
MQSYLVFFLLVLNSILLAVIFMRSKGANANQFKGVITDALLSQFTENRIELQNALKENRKEFSEALDKLSKNIEEKMYQNAQTQEKSAHNLRIETKTSLHNFSEVLNKSIKDFNQVQKEKFDQMNVKQQELVKTTEVRLEKMRETVDEKLQTTLEKRLGESFKLVSERLEAVQKGLGEMQNLAHGVGDLKKVLSNVKTRGVLGEIQLGNILEQIMSPEQYDKDVRTKRGSNDHVEFAIKLPGKDHQGKEVYLPIDAKFPQEDYIRLQEAYDSADLAAIEQAKKSLVRSIKNFAKSIRDKYIDPPYTTDFGILFLPIEGLFAELVRQPELVAILQRDYKIIITGPTTLAAMLNSLQMGFKTLAIQKRSSEVWDILGAVKTEFSKFGGVLEKAQKKITEANKELDTLVGTRTRMM